MYISIERKIRNNCEIQNAECSKSGVMLRLLLVKDKQDSDIHAQENNEGLTHGTDIIKYLTLTWYNSEQGFCADFYFASV